MTEPESSTSRDEGLTELVTDEMGQPARDAAAAGFDHEAVDGLLTDRPTVEKRRPALRKLNDDQREVLGEFIDGFDSRAGFLTWCQRAAILSLGELPGEWFVQRSFSALDMSTLIVSDERYRWAARADRDVLEPAAARDARRGVAAIDLLPAFSRAHRRLRWNATEYVNDHDDSFQPEPEEQRHPAMRPELTELHKNQAWALRALLDGFTTDDALLSWVHTLTEASFAEVDSGLARRFYAEAHTREMLLANTDDDPATLQFFRECVGAKYLLPSFSRAAQEVGERAGELAEKQSDGLKFSKMG